MHYKEFIPLAELSPFIESYWYIDPEQGKGVEFTSYYPPDCTFEIIISEGGFSFKDCDELQWNSSSSDALLFGLPVKGRKYKSHASKPLFGIRIKIFALYPLLIDSPAVLLGSYAEIDKILKPSALNKDDLYQMTHADHKEKVVDAANKFFIKALARVGLFDQKLRAQVNYILDRKGKVKITDMYSHFNISKHKLQRDFQSKLGLSPKMVSKIWRFNYFLQLCYERPADKLTDLGIDAGYYDQAHLIKDVRSFINDKPKNVLRNMTDDFQIYQQVIQRRFNNIYDPIGS